MNINDPRTWKDAGVEPPIVKSVFSYEQVADVVLTHIAKHEADLRSERLRENGGDFAVKYGIGQAIEALKDLSTELDIKYGPN